MSSHSTRRIDKGEKKESYLSMPSWSAYVLIEQEFQAAVVYRRIENGFERIVLDDADSIIVLHDPDLTLELRKVYRDINFSDIQPYEDGQ